MRINNPVPTLKDLEEKMLRHYHDKGPYISKIPAELYWDDGIYFIKFIHPLPTQQQIIKYYHEL